MIRAGAAISAVALAALGLLAPARPPAGVPLWPGSSFTTRDRDAAVRRGLAFIASAAQNPETFDAYGPDLSGAFLAIYGTSADARLRRVAWNFGRECARRWRALNPAVPKNAGATDVFSLLSGADVAERFGLPDPAFRRSAAAAARQFRAEDFLEWDPKIEPPPSDMPNPCQSCKRTGRRGSTHCDRCGRPLTVRSRYDVWLDALVLAYTGDHAGITLGVCWKDVARWAGALRPYPRKGTSPDRDFDDAIYAVTHLVYTYNDYSENLVPADCLPQEFAFLKDSLPVYLAARDAETVGELLDSLRAFGLTLSDAGIREGFDFLLRAQNPDGSWGDPGETDTYIRYHTAWTAVDGLREYRWTRVLPCLGP